MDTNQLASGIGRLHCRILCYCCAISLAVKQFIIRTYFAVTHSGTRVDLIELVETDGGQSSNKTRTHDPTTGATVWNTFFAVCLQRVVTRCVLIGRQLVGRFSLANIRTDT